MRPELRRARRSILLANPVSPTLFFLLVRWGVPSVFSYRFAQLAGNGWLNSRDPINIQSFTGQGRGGAVLLTEQSRFTANGEFSGNVTDGEGGFALVQDEVEISIIDSMFSDNESEGNGGAIALVGMSEGFMADGIGGETIFQHNLSAGSGGAIFRGGSSQLTIRKVGFLANESVVAGGMSMVFPGCSNEDPPGNVAYSGSRELGFEALITRAERLSAIFGCIGGDVTPGPNARGSGSYFDPERNGEGLIIEWLPDGRVLVVMFTYSPEGKQMWMIGVAEAQGDSMTVEALYPTGFTQWGSGFDAGDVALDDWGTFSLTWTDEDHVTFEHESTADGYGSATRNYQRLSTLAEPD